MRIHRSSKNVRKIAGRSPIAPLGAYFNIPNTHEFHETAAELVEAASVHPYTFATMDAVTRSAIGTGYQIVNVDEFKAGATKLQKKKLLAFLNYIDRRWDNIKDFQSFPDKLAQTINVYRLIGQASWEIIRDGNGNPVGFDVLSGVVIPNTNERGYFETPNFRFYPWNKSQPIDYHRDNIVFFSNAGIRGRITGESVYESLTSTAMISDMFAAISYRSLFENVNSPYNGIWKIDPVTSDEDTEMVMSMLDDMYTGAYNYGRNPIAVRGGLDFVSINSRNKEDAPYIEGRHYNREEFLSVTGVDGNKLGITESSNKANMRETRREFHENTLRPLFIRLEEDIYNQVCVRLLGIKGWKFQFNRPDITTAVEQMSIDMRALQWGIQNPNEIRAQRGLDPRAGGDVFYLPLNLATVDPSGKVTDVSEGHGEGDTPAKEEGGKASDEENPEQATNEQDKPEEVREPSDERPVSSKFAQIDELKKWRKLHLQMMDGKKPFRKFEPKFIASDDAEQVSKMLMLHSGDFETTKKIFDAAIEYLGE
jgi:HK97 family phage portal protein